MVGWIWKRAAISDVVWSPLRAARATLDLNDGLYCLRFLLMILLLVEMMNQSLGTCPNFGVHFRRLSLPLAFPDSTWLDRLTSSTASSCSAFTRNMTRRASLRFLVNNIFGGIWP